MASATDLARACVASAIKDAGESGLSEDAVARALISEAINIFKKTRSNADIASELEFFAEHLSEEEDYNFMRP